MYVIRFVYVFISSYRVNTRSEIKLTCLLMVSLPQLSSKFDCDSRPSAILRVCCLRVSSPFFNEFRVHKLKTIEKVL